jgi:hypothetical protein
VTNKRHVGESPGGVQTCSREYLALLAAANIAIEVLETDVDQRPVTRLVRQLRTSPYTGSMSTRDLHKVEAAAENMDIIFLNQVNLASALARLHQPERVRPKVVLLSHGAEVTDLLNLIRARQCLPLSGCLRPTPERTLRNVLMDEIAARVGVRTAVCLSPFDADFERWLGVSNVTWIPRTVTPRPLDWRPIANRFGFLGTLDHAPNLQGLVEILDKIESLRLKHIEIRIVGGPPRIGQWLSQRFRFATYLGALDDASLEPEAATWSAFLNPIFCQARGCSTKLATALAWQIPIITTPVGRRGYVWRRGALIEANSVERFVGEMKRLQCADFVIAARLQTIAVAESCPTMDEIARTFVDFLGEVGGTRMPVKPE